MPKHKLIATISLSALMTLVSSCASHRSSGSAYMGNTETLEGLQAMGRSNASQAKQLQKSNIRAMAVKETAYSIGAQSGLAYRAKHINDYLIRHAVDLDKIYNFNVLVLENNVLPPVLSEGHNSLNLSLNNEIRVAQTTYKIDRQAQFITAPPNWRQYLWMDYHLPKRPHYSVLPKDNLERNVWDQYTYEGWQKGIEQADSIFADNQARLKHDFSGMILYRKLFAMNMVSPPYVSHTELGITGDKDKIRIDDRVLRIVALPELKPNSKEWRASVTKLDDRLKQFRKMEKLAQLPKIEITDKAWQPVIPNVE